MESNRFNSIMDENWKAMNGILDTEMPIANKRRRSILLWLLTFGMIGISASLFFYKSQQMVPKDDVLKTTTPKPKVILANNIFVSKEEIIKVEPKNYSKAKAIKPGISSILSSTSSSNVISSEILIHQPVYTNHSFHSTKEFSNSNVFDTHSNDVIPIEDKDISGVGFEKKISVIEQNKYSINPLSLIEIKRIDVTSTLIEPSVVKLNTRDIYKFGLIASCATTSFESVSSFFIGMQGDRALNKSLSMYTNLGWRQFRGSNINIQIETNEKYELESTFSGSSTSSPQQLDNTLGQLIISDITNTVNYAELGSGVRYRISSRVAIQGGINLGVFLSETYDINTKTRIHYKSLTKDAQFDLLVADTKEHSFHQRWISHVNIGLDVQLNSSLSAFGNVHRLLNNNKQIEGSNLSGQLANKNWAELGMKYNFMK